MDKEKAIQILKRCEAESHCNHYKQHYCCIGCGQREALDLAIMALKQMESEDCISRQQATEAIEGVDWYHVNSKGELVSGSTSDEESWYKAEDVYKAIESLPPTMPPKKVVAQINIDTEELIERIKEEYEITDKVGEWVKVTDVAPPEFTGRYVCSNCKAYALMNMPYGSKQELSNFCPNCGADMRDESISNEELENILNEIKEILTFYSFDLPMVYGDGEETVEKAVLLEEVDYAIQSIRDMKDEKE